MDGDSRGGAALSVRAVSGKPIKFVGTGEKLEALEPFYPDRTASRILGARFPFYTLLSRMRDWRRWSAFIRTAPPRASWVRALSLNLLSCMRARGIGSVPCFWEYRRHPPWEW